ncbi:MAG: hypothetical protein HOI95_20225 [Chromatiales bacterium]|nr:hypothetical protein [Chromatiales bacterium]
MAGPHIVDPAGHHVPKNTLVDVAKGRRGEHWSTVANRRMNHGWSPSSWRATHQWADIGTGVLAGVAPMLSRLHPATLSASARAA